MELDSAQANTECSFAGINFAGLGITLSLKIARIKEQLWVNHSSRFLKMSDISKLILSLITKEGPTVSELLSPLFKEDLHKWFARDLSKWLSKMSSSLEKIHIFVCFWQFFIDFPKSKSLPLLFLLFFKEWWEWFTLSLFTKEQPWAICFRCSWQKSNWNERITLLLTKTSDSLKKPISKFPTLQFWLCTAVLFLPWKRVLF